MPLGFAVAEEICNDIVIIFWVCRGSYSCPQHDSVVEALLAQWWCVGAARSMGPSCTTDRKCFNVLWTFIADDIVEYCGAV